MGRPAAAAVLPSLVVLAGSLLLCAAAGALWARSFVVYDRILYQTEEDAGGVQRCFVLGWSRGALAFEHHHIAGLGRAYADWMGLHMEHDTPFTAEPRGFALAGFSFDPPLTTRPLPATWWRYTVVVPHYAVVLAAAAAAAASARRLRRLRSQGPDDARRCRVCRYDLRAHAANARCPECGTTAASPQPAAA